MIETISISFVALIAEALAGYPAWLFRMIGHPVTWMGAVVSALDRRLNREADRARKRRVWGLVSLVALVVPFGCAGLFLQHACVAALSPSVCVLVAGLLASTCVAQRSLDAHVRAVAEALERADLADARDAVGKIVGRDTAALDQAGIARAAIESLAENFADGVVAPAFWIAVFGVPGGLMYKAINTADSMIGHRTLRHEAFGFAAAKVDDAVNWLPARLAALWLVGAATVFAQTSARAAWRILRRDAHGHPSPNAGWPEAAMAGALGVRLSGPRAYGGRAIADHPIGDDRRPADAAAIRAALRVYRAACGLQVAVLAGVTLLIARSP